jgi:hypothetical protein
MAEFQKVETSFSGDGDCCRCQEERVSAASEDDDVGRGWRPWR